MRRKSKQIILKTDEEVELIRENCLIVSKALALVASLLKPGVTGEMIDREAETLIRDLGSVPGFKGLYDFPATLCISVNHAVVHGIPTKQEFKEGDIISVDCGSYMNEFYGDAAYTFALGEIPQEVEELLSVTKTSLYKGIEQAVHGKRVEDIGHAIQNYCEKEHGYGVVRELVGHGLGKTMHEAPEVPNYGRRGRGPLMKDGLVIAIEPMINLGKRNVATAEDGWTIVTQDKKPSAHYEHTVVVRKKKADILSNHDLIEEEIKNNSNIREILIKN